MPMLSCVRLEQIHGNMGNTDTWQVGGDLGHGGGGGMGVVCRETHKEAHARSYIHKYVLRC